MLRKIARNQINRLNIFRWIPGFGMCSMAKSENQEMPGMKRKIFKSENINA